MEPKLALDNLGAGKIENFWIVYGRRPYAAFGSSVFYEVVGKPA
jgi:hypothetical protein